MMGEGEAGELLRLVSVPDVASRNSQDKLGRDVIALALCFLLLRRILADVPEASRYAAMAGARRIHFDHGALRTVRADWMGSLPSGELSIKRLLVPLGYAHAGTYPLPGLKMTGRAYAHQDNPLHIPQFFVSEIHPEAFSPAVQDAARSIFGGSVDPLDSAAKSVLAALERDGAVSFKEAVTVLPTLEKCFGRHHPTPDLTSYEVLLEESAEFAWIATEGNSFNHATDRVADLDGVVDDLRRNGFSMKDEVEVSITGLVRQTAFKAAQVERIFRGRNGDLIKRIVPGSFFEFISRGKDERGNIDLRFDSSNAQGIFKMTAPP